MRSSARRNRRAFSVTATACGAAFAAMEHPDPGDIDVYAVNYRPRRISDADTSPGCLNWRQFGLQSQFIVKSTVHILFILQCSNHLFVLDLYVLS
jgi:hypothetical protein